MHARRANRLERGKSVKVGDQAIEDQDRVFIAGGKKDRVPPRRAIVDDVAGFAQQPGDMVAHVRIIFEQQEFHRYHAMRDLKPIASSQFPIFA